MHIQYRNLNDTCTYSMKIHVHVHSIETLMTHVDVHTVKKH